MIVTVTEHSEKTMVDAAVVAERIAAARNMETLKSSGVFDELMGQIDRGEIELDGKDGCIQQLIRAGLEGGLCAQLPSADHTKTGVGSPLSGNGKYANASSFGSARVGLHA